MPVLRWSHERRVDWHNTVPVKPQHNAFVESLNGRMRTELLMRRYSLCSPRMRSACSWKDDYNTIRPHGGLDNLPPADYAKRGASVMQRGGALGLRAGYARRTVASPTDQGSND